MVYSYDTYFGMTATEYSKMRRATQTRHSCTASVLCNLLVSMLLRYPALSTTSPRMMPAQIASFYKSRVPPRAIMKAARGYRQPSWGRLCAGSPRPDPLQLSCFAAR